MNKEHIFADQLNALFAKACVRTTNAMLAEALTDRGCPISAPYLSQLRNKVRTRPAQKYIKHIAEYFEVPLTYFYDLPDERGSDSTTIKNQDKLLISDISNTSVRRLLTQTHNLSPTSMDLLVVFADRLSTPLNARKQSRDPTFGTDRTKPASIQS